MSKTATIKIKSYSFPVYHLWTPQYAAPLKPLSVVEPVSNFWPALPPPPPPPRPCNDRLGPGRHTVAFLGSSSSPACHGVINNSSTKIMKINTSQTCTSGEAMICSRSSCMSIASRVCAPHSRILGYSSPLQHSKFPTGWVSISICICAIICMPSPSSRICGSVEL